MTVVTGMYPLSFTRVLTHLELTLSNLSLFPLGIFCAEHVCMYGHLTKTGAFYLVVGTDLISLPEFP